MPMTVEAINGSRCICQEFFRASWLRLSAVDSFLLYNLVGGISSIVRYRARRVGYSPTPVPPLFLSRQSTSLAKPLSRLAAYRLLHLKPDENENIERAVVRSSAEATLFASKEHLDLRILSRFALA